MIDLGVMTRDGEIPPYPSARLNRRLTRRFGVAAVALLTVFTATGSVGSMEPAVRPLWSTSFDDGESMTLDATTLYTGQRADGQVTLRAFDLATGRVRWSVPTGNSDLPLQAPTAGVLVMPNSIDDERIPQGDDTYLVQPYVSSTIARDAATGRELWTQAGDSLLTSPSSVLLGDNDGHGLLTRIRVVGLRDGVTRWTKPVAGIDGWTVAETGDRPTRIVLTGPAGALTVLDYADGSTMTTGRLPYSDTQRVSEGVYTGLEVIGEQLVVSRSNNAGSASVVYRLDTLQKLWTADGFVIDCGAMLCVMEPTGLAAHDPVTGAVRWRRPDLGGVWQVSNRRILANAPSTLGPYEVLDPATGRIIGEPVSGEPAWGGGLLTGSVLLTGVVPENPKLSSVIQLDLGTGTSYLLGTIPYVAHFGCQGVPGFLVCVRPGAIDVTAVG